MGGTPDSAGLCRCGLLDSRLVGQLLHTLANKRNDAEYTATPHSFHQAKQCLSPFSAKIRKWTSLHRRNAQWRVWRRRRAPHRHWRSVKFTDHWEEEEEDGARILHDRERFSHELTLVFANGDTQIL